MFSVAGLDLTQLLSRGGVCAQLDFFGSGRILWEVETGKDGRKETGIHLLKEELVLIHAERPVCRFQLQKSTSEKYKKCNLKLGNHTENRALPKRKMNQASYGVDLGAEYEEQMKKKKYSPQAYKKIFVQTCHFNTQNGSGIPPEEYCCCL